MQGPHVGPVLPPDAETLWIFHGVAVWKQPYAWAAVLLLTVGLKRITGLGRTATLDGRLHWASSHLCPSSLPKTSCCSLSLPQAHGFKYCQCADDPYILISSLDLSSIRSAPFPHQGVSQQTPEEEEVRVC